MRPGLSTRGVSLASPFQSGVTVVRARYEIRGFSVGLSAGAGHLDPQVPACKEAGHVPPPEKMPRRVAVGTPAELHEIFSGCLLALSAPIPRETAHPAAIARRPTRRPTVAC